MKNSVKFLVHSSKHVEYKVTTSSEKYIEYWFNHNLLLTYIHIYSSVTWFSIYTVNSSRSRDLEVKCWVFRTKVGSSMNVNVKKSMGNISKEEIDDKFTQVVKMA